MQKFEKLASMGAAAVAGGCFVAYSFLVFIFRPTPNGGFNHLLWLVVSFAMIVPVAVIASAHMAFARELKDGSRTMPR